jgi:ABC-type enterobactin transport system permease subunit
VRLLLVVTVVVAVLAVVVAAVTVVEVVVSVAENEAAKVGAGKEITVTPYETPWVTRAWLSTAFTVGGAVFPRLLTTELPKSSRDTDDPWGILLSVSTMS